MDQLQVAPKTLTLVRAAIQKLLRPSRRQKKNCHIVHLPSHPLSLIVDHLPLHARLLLAGTCRFLRESLRKSLCHEPLQREDAIEYLTCLARDIPKRWVCEVCLRLHPVCHFDVPSNPDKTTCPRGGSHNRLQHGWYGWSNGFKISHRHKQMALKYTRLGIESSLSRSHKKHLQSLVGAYKCCFRPSKRGSAQARAYGTFYPKIVRGRYLVQSCYTYCNVDMGAPISLDNLGKMIICPHQSFNFDDYDWRETRTCRLSRLIEEGFKMPAGSRTRDSCEWCLTDFQVQCTRKETKIWAWSDLGSEGSSLELAWILQAFPHWNRVDARPQAHKSGSIQTAFYSEKSFWAIHNGFDDEREQAYCSSDDDSYYVPVIAC